MCNKQTYVSCKESTQTIFWNDYFFNALGFQLFWMLQRQWGWNCHMIWSSVYLFCFSIKCFACTGHSEQISFVSNCKSSFEIDFFQVVSCKVTSNTVAWLKFNTVYQIRETFSSYALSVVFWREKGVTALIWQRKWHSVFCTCWLCQKRALCQTFFLRERWNQKVQLNLKTVCIF